MSSQGGASYGEVPNWNGDPSSSERFCVACKWFSYSLEESERKHAAARIWAKLQGPAKSVVRNLDPEQFIGNHGVDRLLEILRKSPLQRLPIPDSFQRLEKWSGLRRRRDESIPQMLVREEEIFQELISSLQRAQDFGLIRKGAGRGTMFAEEETEETDEDEPKKESAQAEETPQESQTGGSPKAQEDDKTSSAPSWGSSPSKKSSPAKVKGGISDGFFERELRGYRLLKAAALRYTERQQILTLTGNSTRFEMVRQALRSLYDDGVIRASSGKSRAAWFADYEDPGAYYQDEWYEDEVYAEWPVEDEDYGYWTEWGEESWESSKRLAIIFGRVLSPGCPRGGAGGDDRGREEPGKGGCRGLWRRRRSSTDAEAGA